MPREPTGLTETLPTHQTPSVAVGETTIGPTPDTTTPRPQTTATAVAAPPPQHRTYVVQSGDTLTRIADGFGVPMRTPMEENSKEDTLLRIGEQLVIPPAAFGTHNRTVR